MANKKKKKKAPRITPRELLHSVTIVERRQDAQFEHIKDLETFSHTANSKITDQQEQIDVLKNELRNIRKYAQREAELRVEAESMVYRKLIHTLMADRQGVDMFLDKLSDLAPEIVKGVLVGTFEDLDLVGGVRPERKDDSPTPV